ncbi:MAG TPA: hypothetical protein VKZ18_24765 [Polyangia bacterium]|nr:hypothetical protein [Polyangia bacterium]
MSTLDERKPHPQGQHPQKRTELIEAEGRILRLEYDPAAPTEAAAANLRIFAEVAAIGLNAADVDRVRKALQARAAKGAR